MDERWVLIDARTGLHVRWYFWLRVLDEANRAARYGEPFGLLLLEAEAEPSGHQTRTLEEASARVPQVIRSTDLGGTLGRGRVGIVLPHQDASAAEQAAARIMSELARLAPHSVRWTPWLLRHPDDAADISNLLTNGWPERSEPERRRNPARSA